MSEGCARVEARLPLLLDGALGALEEARDRGHLEACAPCRDLRVEYERLLERLPAAWSARVAPELPALLAAVRTELAGRPVPRRARRAPSPVLAAAVAAGLLVLLRLWLGPELAPFSAGGSAVEIDPLLQRLPSWSQLWGGVEQLSRWVS